MEAKMEIEEELYICEKCGHELLKSNKIMHDLKCIEKKNVFPENNFENNNQNFNNKDFKCDICGIYLEEKLKLDHLLCHDLDKGPINFSINNNLNSKDFIEINHIDEIDNDLPQEENEEKEEENEGIEENEPNEEQENFGDDSFEENDFDEDDRLDEEIIKNLPISIMKDVHKLSEDSKKCLICFDEFNNGDKSIFLPCIHIFHEACIKKWLSKKNACPICKNKIDPNNNNI